MLLGETKEALSMGASQLSKTLEMVFRFEKLMLDTKVQNYFFGL